MADLLVVGTLHTLDPARPRAGALLARDGRIVRVGSRAECERAAAPGARVIDLGAGSAVPGLVDAHGHVLWYGRAAREVGCAGAGSPGACAALVAKRARSTPPGGWIRGRGWDQNRWPGAAFPSADLLDRAAPGHPVLLTRVDGHAGWASRAALAAAGIGPDTPDPPGGRILRGPGGEPTGVVLDAALERVLAAVPRPGPEELEAGLLEGLGGLAALGLTGVHDAGCAPEHLDAYRRLAAAGRLPIRVYAMIDGSGPADALEEALRRARPEPESGLLTVRAVKLFADGALGSRGAALLEDYADDPGNRGLLLLEPPALLARLAAVAAAGFQPAVHAIGDRANREVLRALVALAPRLRALRPRIEHLQILDPADLPLVAEAGAIASMQPVHATSDAPWVAARLGAGTARLRGAYAWRTLARAGAVLALGSDFPVEPPDPRAGLHAAEARRAATGTPLAPWEALDRLEALRGFTEGPAWAGFAEDRRGVLREGMDADLTAFAEDVLSVDPGVIPRLTVTHTVAAGRVILGD